MIRCSLACLPRAPVQGTPACVQTPRWSAPAHVYCPLLQIPGSHRREQSNEKLHYHGPGWGIPEFRAPISL